ncbi:MAG: PorP/SprF family type IX secretion system membrane protein [Cyclobacteriaceae bacterium]
MVCLQLSFEIKGQEVAHFTQFFFNPSSLNPSLTGIDGQSAAFLSYSRQWIGIEGSPVLGQFSIQAPSPDRLAIGLNVNQDERGVIGTSSVLLSSAYNIPISKDVFFRYGFSLGAGFFKTDLSALRFGTIAADPVISNLPGSDIQLLANTGASIHTKTFHLGLSIPNLFRFNYLAAEPFNVGTFGPLDQIILHASYRYYLQKGKYLFEPFINYRLNQNRPSQIEVAGLLHLQNLVWVGASYKQDFGISGMVGFKFSPAMAVGYSYSIKNTGLNQLASPSHEVQVGMLFGARHRNIPVYSFVNAEKPKVRGRPATMMAQKKKPAPVMASKGTVVAKSGFQPKTAAPLKPKEQPVKQEVTQNSKPDPNQSAPAKTPAKEPDGKAVSPLETAVATKDEQQPEKQLANQKQVEKPVGPATIPVPVKSEPADLKSVEIKPAQKEVATTQSEVTKPIEGVDVAIAPSKSPATESGGSARLKEQKVEFSTPDPRDRPDNNQAGTPRLKEVISTPVEEAADDEGEDADLLHGTSHLADSLQEVDERERLGRLDKHMDNPMEIHEGTAPHSERYERVKRGSHKEEMDLGDYVIIGVFKSEANAKRLSDGIKGLGFPDVDYGYLTNKSIWYVHFEGTDNLEEAKATREKYRKIKLFRDAWLLTVHP